MSLSDLYAPTWWVLSYILSTITRYIICLQVIRQTKFHIVQMVAATLTVSHQCLAPFQSKEERDPSAKCVAKWDTMHCVATTILITPIKRMKIEWRLQWQTPTLSTPTSMRTPVLPTTSLMIWSAWRLENATPVEITCKLQPGQVCLLLTLGILLLLVTITHFIWTIFYMFPKSIDTCFRFINL